MPTPTIRTDASQSAGRHVDLTLGRAADTALAFLIADANGQKITDDLSAWTWLLWISTNESDDEALFSVEAAAPGQGVDNTAKTITVSVPPEATDNLDPAVIYYWEFRRIDDGSGAILARGKLNIRGGPGDSAAAVTTTAAPSTTTAAPTTTTTTTAAPTTTSTTTTTPGP